MSKTKIPWTDETWPVVTGCSPCSIGCTNCYAARMAATRLKHHPRYEGLATISNGKARWTGEVRLNHDVLEQPLHWKKPRRVFVASMSDLLHNDVPEQFIFRVLRVTRDTPQHTYQILTKRPGRMTPVMREYYARLRAAYGSKAEEPQRNLWLGVSVENQAAADERISLLLQTPAAVRFVSVEPMLGAVNLSPYLRCLVCGMRDWNFNKFQAGHRHTHGLDWIICGGESGPGARPMHPDWARSLRDQCQAAGVPYFFKQHGAWLHESQFLEPITIHTPYVVTFEERSFPTHQWADGNQSYRVGKKRAGHLLDGRTWQQFPVADGAGNR